MKAIVKFYEGSKRVIVDSQKRADEKKSMAMIQNFLAREENGDLMDKLIQMKFTDPMLDKNVCKKQFDDLHNALDRAFNDLATSSGRI